MLEINGAVLIPLILGLVEIFKGLGVQKKFLPLISLALGLLAGIFYVYPNELKSGIIFGLMLGLSASGLYSGTKHSIKKTHD